jgi:hypothetical protein
VQLITEIKREREREREGGGGSERHHAGGDENINFLFEGSQAMPASPSDRGKILFKVRGAALERDLDRH